MKEKQNFKFRTEYKKVEENNARLVKENEQLKKMMGNVLRLKFHHLKIG